MRLDAIVSETFHISRQRSKKLIEAKQVQVNWLVVDRPDFQVDLSDMLSVRKYGRILIKDVLGQTRKERIKLAIGTLRRHRITSST